MSGSDKENLKTNYQDRIAEQFALDMVKCSRQFASHKAKFYAQNSESHDVGTVDRTMTFDEIIEFLTYLREQENSEESQGDYNKARDVLLGSIEEVKGDVLSREKWRRWKMWTRISLVPGIISLGALIAVLVLTKAAPIWTIAAIVEYVVPAAFSALFLTLTAVCAWKKSVNQRHDSSTESIFNDLNQMIQAIEAIEVTNVLQVDSDSEESKPLLITSHVKSTKGPPWCSSDSDTSEPQSTASLESEDNTTTRKLSLT